MNTSNSQSAEIRALGRLETLAARLATVAETIEASELDWSPDEGIPAMRDHVCGLVRGVRILNRRLAPRSGGGEPALAEVSSAELLRCLVGGHDRCRQRVAKLRAAGEPLPMSFLDAMPTSGDFELRMNETGNVVTLWLNNTNKPQVHVIRKRKLFLHSSVQMY